jgi:dephospho-CoA kinase
LQCANSLVYKRVNHALKVGLTGGIGSGKSTVMQLLFKAGAHCIDADEISKASTAPGGASIASIEAVFGSSVLTKQGALDREKMRELVFNNAEAKTQLESIVHPIVGVEINRQTALAQAQGAQCIVFDIPLLVESAHWRKSLDRIVVVDCSYQTQIDRVALRNGFEISTIQKIINLQASRTTRLQAADFIVFNDGITLIELGRQVQEIASEFGL